MLTRATDQAWDLIVIGGGATGAGVAVDAASRGYSVLLLEQHDFGKGTSSRSTKLVHGGVRYLERGDVGLVREALRERARLRNNAPHLVQIQPFLIPAYRWWESTFYGTGLRVYDLLAGRHGFGATRQLNRHQVIRRLPTVQRESLRGGILYHDGRFDDARLLINLMQTATEHGGVVLNYARVIRLTSHDGGHVRGVIFRDEETGQVYDVRARGVINATGAFCDTIRRFANSNAGPLVRPSQGVHLVFDRDFLPGNTAMMVPKTPDGRVMFAIPWLGHTLVGTTDVAVPTAELEPQATEPEIEMILETAGRYLARTPTRADVRSVFAGVRPLVQSSRVTNTARLSREHTILVENGLLTITGGKWTTYRAMAEDCVNRAAELVGLPRRQCRTASLPLHGWWQKYDPDDPLALYGSDGPVIRSWQRSDSPFAERLHPELPYTVAEVIWAVRYEMARTVEDVLARRLRALMQNATAAREMAPRVAELLAAELGHDATWQADQVQTFSELATGYQLTKSEPGT